MFYFFNPNSRNLAKINSALNVYPVFNLSISLVTLIVPTFLSFSGYQLQGTIFWEHNFLLNLFSRNILWRFHPKTGNPIQQKISDREDFCKKAHGYFKNLKQNIWTEFLPVPMFDGLRDS